MIGIFRKSARLIRKLIKFYLILKYSQINIEKKIGDIGKNLESIKKYKEEINLSFINLQK